MRNLFKLRLPVEATIAVAASIAVILFAGTACQSKKGAKGPDYVGENVKMVELGEAIYIFIFFWSLGSGFTFLHFLSAVATSIYIFWISGSGFTFLHFSQMPFTFLHFQVQ